MDIIDTFGKFGPVWLMAGFLMLSIVSMLWFLIRQLKRINDIQLEMIEQLARHQKTWGDAVYRVIIRDTKEILRLIDEEEKEKTR